VSDAQDSVRNSAKRRERRILRPAASGAAEAGLRPAGGTSPGGVNGARVLHFQKVAGISGSEAHLLSLLPRLRERGWDIRLLMFHEHEPGAWDFARELEARGVPLDAIPISRDVDPVAFMRLVDYLGRERPQILHTHLVHADAYGQIAGALSRVPVRVSTKHGFNEFREGRAFALADRGVASLAHVHIAISRGLARYLSDTEGFAADDFDIVHYGIAPRGEPPPYAARDPRLLCVGRLIPIKGHIVLLRAFADARREVPGLTLDIAGRGPLEPALKALTRELGIADAVRFLGYVSPIQEAIEESAVIVVPSMGEGFGMVALEAMERARPVVAASIGGLGELVEDGQTGLLVEPGEAEPLARAIVRLAGDLELAANMGAAGRRRALGEFLEERCIERTEMLYERALARNGKSGPRQPVTDA
jgi:glycosyltransferase involved in cell wall biosynthesis